MKRIIIFLIIIVCLIVLSLNSCTTSYYSTKVVIKKDFLIFWTKYRLQEIDEDEQWFGEYARKDNFFNLVTRNDTIDELDFYVLTKKYLKRKN